MLFRNAEGKLVEINRCDYKSDHIYYKNILKLKSLPNNDPKEINYSKILIQDAIFTDSTN